MIKNFFFLFVFLISSLPSITYSQTSKETGDLGENSLRDLIIVGGTGSMGAILGLSTLSFVEEPSEHLKNVYMGASLGIILGVSFVAYQTANREQENLVKIKRLKHQLTPEFKTAARLSWHQLGRAEIAPKSIKNQVINLNFEF